MSLFYLFSSHPCWDRKKKEIIYEKFQCDAAAVAAFFFISVGCFPRTHKRSYQTPWPRSILYSVCISHGYALCQSEIPTWKTLSFYWNIFRGFFFLSLSLFRRFVVGVGAVSLAVYFFGCAHQQNNSTLLKSNELRRMMNKNAPNDIQQKWGSLLNFNKNTHQSFKHAQLSIWTHTNFKR